MAPPVPPALPPSPARAPDAAAPPAAAGTGFRDTLKKAFAEKLVASVLGIFTLVGSAATAVARDPVGQLSLVAFTLACSVATALALVLSARRVQGAVMRLVVSIVTIIALIGAAQKYDQRSLDLPDTVQLDPDLAAAMDRQVAAMYGTALNQVDRLGRIRVGYEANYKEKTRVHVILPFRWAKRETSGLSRTYEGAVRLDAVLHCDQSGAALLEPTIEAVRLGHSEGVLAFLTAPFEAPFLFSEHLLQKVFWPPVTGQSFVGGQPFRACTA